MQRARKHRVFYEILVPIKERKKIIDTLHKEAVIECWRKAFE